MDLAVGRGTEPRSTRVFQGRSGSGTSRTCPPPRWSVRLGGSRDRLGERAVERLRVRREVGPGSPKSRWKASGNTTRSVPSGVWAATAARLSAGSRVDARCTSATRSVSVTLPRVRLRGSGHVHQRRRRRACRGWRRAARRRRQGHGAPEGRNLLEHVWPPWRGDGGRRRRGGDAHVATGALHPRGAGRRRPGGGAARRGGGVRRDSRPGRRPRGRHAVRDAATFRRLLAAHPPRRPPPAPSSSTATAVGSSPASWSRRCCPGRRTGTTCPSTSSSTVSTWCRCRPSVGKPPTSTPGTTCAEIQAQMTCRGHLGSEGDRVNLHAGSTSSATSSTSTPRSTRPWCWTSPGRPPTTSTPSGADHDVPARVCRGLEDANPAAIEALAARRRPSRSSGTVRRTHPTPRHHRRGPRRQRRRPRHRPFDD